MSLQVSLRVLLSDVIQEQGLTVVEAADRIGVHYSLLVSLLHGNATADLLFLDEALRKLGTAATVQRSRLALPRVVVKSILDENP